jgi:hypothetical protein
VETWMWVMFGAAAFGVVAAVGFRGSALSRALKHARKTGEVADLAEVIATSPDKGQATRWDHAINSLWQGYSREAATLLVVEAATRSDADIVQYWIGQILQVEPEFAGQHFSEDFLAEHFEPEVASRCGRKGCCGG